MPTDKPDHDDLKAKKKVIKKGKEKQSPNEKDMGPGYKRWKEGKLKGKKGDWWGTKGKWKDAKPKTYPIGKEKSEQTTEATTPKKKKKNTEAKTEKKGKGVYAEKPEDEPDGKNWCLYILGSLDPKYPNNTYVGISNDVKKRERSHNNSKSGAYVTRLRRPWRCFAYIEGFPNYRACMNAERALKTVNRQNKNYSGVAGRMASIVYCLTKLERWTPSYVNEISKENYVIYTLPKYIDLLQELESVTNVEIKEQPWRHTVMKYKNSAGHGNYELHIDEDGNPERPDNAEMAKE